MYTNIAILNHFSSLIKWQKEEKRCGKAILTREEEICFLSELLGQPEWNIKINKKFLSSNSFLRFTTNFAIRI